MVALRVSLGWATRQRLRPTQDVHKEAYVRTRHLALCQGDDDQHRGHAYFRTWRWPCAGRWPFVGRGRVAPWPPRGAGPALGISLALPCCARWVALSRRPVRFPPLRWLAAALIGSCPHLRGFGLRPQCYRSGIRSGMPLTHATIVVAQSRQVCLVRSTAGGSLCAWPKPCRAACAGWALGPGTWARPLGCLASLPPGLAGGCEVCPPCLLPSLWCEAVASAGSARL